MKLQPTGSEQAERSCVLGAHRAVQRQLPGIGGRRSLSDYYVADYGHAMFDRRLKRRVVFAEHSLSQDRVFSEMHLVSCRNVLIYFDRALQERAIALFDETVLDGGFLGVGNRESLRFCDRAALFSEFAPAERIYRKRGVMP